ncbi:unnamed protein product [Lactuca virosa]|uniref:Uncharacterized protein n=1 Tax=Lactuca virosa TaxID=75947 RepID=A0AAU9NU90_9ASTR|nr:unnamed protein product [Lactuca virosa]
MEVGIGDFAVDFDMYLLFSMDLVREISAMVFPSQSEVFQPRFPCLKVRDHFRRRRIFVVEDERMNKNNTNENVFGDIEDDTELEERNENAGCSRNKFDDDVFDLNDDNKAKEVSEEDDLIITGNVNCYDDYGFDDKEVTPDRPRARNPSKYLCPSYTEIEIFGAPCLGIHTTDGWRQRI